jgi:hypothetical protein
MTMILWTTRIYDLVLFTMIVLPTCAFADAQPLPAAAALTLPVVAPIEFASPTAAAVVQASAANAWGGERNGSESTLSDRVVGYQIQARLDPLKHTIDGLQTMTWRNRSDRAIKTVYLHLYLNAFEGSGSTFMSEKNSLGFGFRSEVDTEEGDWGHIQLRKVSQYGQLVPWQFVHPDGGPSTDHTVVALDLPTPVAAGASTVINIDFQDQLPRIMARTGYYGSFHLVGQWFPKIGVLELAGERGATAPRWNVHEFHLHSEFYADFGTYDVSITAPKDFRIGATGVLQTAPSEKSGWLTHHFMQADVHDFAWTADKKFAAPLTGSYDGVGSPHVAIQVLYTPEYKASAAPALKATIDSLRYFANSLGPYPYATVTVVIPPYGAEEAGGMEYPTFFTAEGFAKVEPDTMAVYALDFVTVHEFGHGYFYGILASNEFEEPMLDEGLNEYWDLRLFRDRGQRIGLGAPWLSRLGIRPSLDAFGLERMVVSGREPADGLGQNSWNRISSGSFGSVYSRTATAIWQSKN